MASLGSAMNIGTLMAHIGLDASQLKTGANEAQGIFGKLQARAGGALGSIGGAFKALGPMAGAFGVALGGLAAIGAFKKMTAEGMEFEKQLVAIRIASKATAEELALLSEEAIELGRTTEHSSTSIAKGLALLSMEGLKPNEQLEVMPDLLDAATASGMELSEIIERLDSILTQTGDSWKQTAKYMDPVVAAHLQTGAAVSELMDGLVKAGPAAEAFGYSMSETTGYIAQLVDRGMAGSKAGMAIAMAFDKANQVAYEFGMSSSDLLDVLAEMDKRGMSSADVMKQFGAKLGGALLQLRDSAGTIREFQQSLEDSGGTTKKVAEESRQSIELMAKVLKNQFQAIGNEAFMKYKDALQTMIADVTKFLQAHGKDIATFIGDTISAILEIAGVIGKIVGWIGDVAGAVGDFFNDISLSGEDAADRLAKSGEDMRNALAPPEMTEWQEFGQNLAVVADNIGKIFVWLGKVIFVSIAAVATFLIKDVIGNILKAFWNLSKAIASMLEGNWKMAGKYAADALKNVSTEFVDDYKKINDSYIKSIGKATDVTRETFERRSAATIATENWEAAKKAAEEAGKAHGDAINGAVEDATTKWQKKVQAVSGAATEAGAWDDEELEGIEGGAAALKSQKGKKTKATGPTAAEIVSAQVAGYQELLKQTDLTTAQMEELWGKYHAVRLAQIEFEAAAMVKSGVPAEEVSAIAEKRRKDLETERADIFKTQKASLDDRIGLLEELLNEEGRKKEEIAAIWKEYHDARLEQIALQMKVMKDEGVAAELVAQVSAKRTRDLLREEQALYGEHKNYLVQFANEAAGDMLRAFQDILFVTMKGEWESILDILKSLWDAFLRRIAADAAAELGGMLNISEKGGGVVGWLFGGAPTVNASEEFVGPPAPTAEHASGGLVFHPEIARIGEVPEAIIPLAKLRDDRFLSRLGIGDRTSSGNTFNFNITTPDIASFQRAKSQLMTQAAVALAATNRNR
jgi:hypothetical protein